MTPKWAMDEAESIVAHVWEGDRLTAEEYIAAALVKAYEKGIAQERAEWNEALVEYTVTTIIGSKNAQT